MDFRESLPIEKYWADQLSQFGEALIPFEHKIRDAKTLAEAQREFFKDTFNYVMNLYSKGKPLDTELLRIHYGITQKTEGYPQKIEQFIRTLMLLSLCGFEYR